MLDLKAWVLSLNLLNQTRRERRMLNLQVQKSSLRCTLRAVIMSVANTSLALEVRTLRRALEKVSELRSLTMFPRV